MHHSRSHSLPAFSLVEVLVAIFVLGIGLLMVAALFPLGGNWTRRSAEEGMAQSVARSAFALIQQRYAQAQAGGMSIANTPDAVLQNVTILPGLHEDPPVIAPNERACDLGTPLPAPAPATCSYFWTALVQKANNNAGGGRAVNLFILVFHKGSADQTFDNISNELPGARPPGASWAPTLAAVSPTRDDAIRPGEFAVGQQSGTLYRRIVDSAGHFAFQPPLDPADNTLLVAPPADGTAASPLVYVYQTTLSF
ncbi:MAG: type IV pilus modification PilV family protein [Phycisphaerae bacterium]